MGVVYLLVCLSVGVKTGEGKVLRSGEGALLSNSASTPA